jgi:hypothetical protein
MLEEIQVSPSELLEVMGLAVSTASRTGIGGTSVGTEDQVEFMGCLIGVQALAQNLPGGSQTQSQSEDVIGAHADPPRRPLPPTWAWVKFHLKRRRTCLFLSLNRLVIALGDFIFQAHNHFSQTVRQMPNFISLGL